MKNPLLTFLLITLLAACDDPSVRGGQTNHMFVDTQSLVNRQIELLDSLKPTVLKQVETNGTTQRQPVRTTDWRRELAAFSDLDISKPGLQTSYTVANAVGGVRLYKLKSGEKADLQWLRIGFDTNTTQILSLEGLLKRRNYLYTFEKHLQMQLQPGQGNNTQLSGYRIVTKQKLISGSEENLRVSGKVASKEQPK